MTKLEKSNVDNIYSLTPLQEGMLFYYLKEGNAIYFSQLTLDLLGNVDQKIFKLAWEKVIESNEILRTTFRWDRIKSPVQIVLKKTNVYYDYIDLSDQIKCEAKLEEIKKSDKNRGFDLNTIPFRLKLIKIGKEKYACIISNHHILYDGWSNGIILKEFTDYYNQIFHGQQINIAVKSKFKDYVTYINSNITDNHFKEFWKEYLYDYKKSNTFTQRSDFKDDTFAVKRLILSVDTLNKLKDLSLKNKTTIANLLYCFWAILLKIYTGKDDVLFGTTLSGRDIPLKGIGKIVGLFINTVPLRLNVKKCSTIQDLINECEITLKQRKSFENLPLVKILESSDFKNDNDLFDSVFVIENYPIDKELSDSKNAISFSSFSIDEINNYKLTTGVIINKNLEISFKYSEKAYQAYFIESLATHFENIINIGIENCDLLLDEIDIFSQEEKENILYSFNKTERFYPKEKLMHQLFEEQVERTPDKIACVINDQMITYRELDRRANCIQQVLLIKGIKPDSIVGLIIEPSLELIIGIFGILKSGAAYLPIDYKSPGERINYIINECNLKFICLSKEIIKEEFNLECIDLKDQSIYKRIESNKKDVSQKNKIAYVIYTSGSSGKPKGVAIKHSNLINYFNWFNNKVQLNQNDRTALVSSYAFDLGYTTLFSSLLCGCQLHILKDAFYQSTTKFSDYIRINEISYLKLTPSLYSVLIENISFQKSIESLRIVVLGGEAIDVNVVEKTLKLNPQINVINHYGPTEATIGCITSLINSENINDFKNTPVIGKPIDNTNVYIVDNKNNIVPVGIAGELCISGEGIAEGYVNNPELNKDRFIDNPYNPNNRLYKTGDVARWLPDGNIEFLGRIDQQVKIRGYRIELGEIENCIKNYNGIKDVKVVAKGESNSQNLYVYYVLKESSGSLQKEYDLLLKEYIASKLPDYMIPKYFIEIENIPLTSNNKLDYKALNSKSIVKKKSKKIVSPKNETEKEIISIWKEVLNLDEIGVNDNFFDIGGDSLLSIRLASRINNFSDKDISVVKIFEYPTIKSLSAFINNEILDDNISDEPTGIEITESDSKSGIETINTNDNEIAVIGISGRFPGANSIHEFWDNLKEGKESITFFEDNSNTEQKNLIKAKGFLKDYDCFDYNFFNYSLRVAKMMDPQIRVFHECVWAALEDAAINSNDYKGIIGMYVGASPNPLWEAAIIGQSSENLWEAGHYYNKDFINTLVSYNLNLKGPSITIDTGCSSSLVAVDMACQSILSGNCDVALAGGVSITFHNNQGYLYREGMINSPDGHCRPFDAEAQGTVGGNGTGVVVLKRLKEAIKDRDNIYAVIKGTAVNNDGSNKVGYTAPSVNGQAKVIQKAQKNGNTSPESISYIEAHGTGTVLGDPIEIEGLKKAFNTSKKGYCAIGSVKSNIGHLDAAAGISGLIKTVFALKNKLLPPSINFKSPNNKIDFNNSPFFVNSKLKEWNNGNIPRRAGVSSFGIGGTNAHVVMEEYQVEKETNQEISSSIISLSARSKNALDEMVHNLADYLKRNIKTNISDVAFTLHIGRKDFEYRKSFIVSDNQNTVETLEKSNIDDITLVDSENTPKSIFMFPGQGSQYVNMGKELYKSEAYFKETIDNCLELVSKLTSLSLKKGLFPLDSSKTEEFDINQTEWAQPITFIFEYALAKMLMKWGIQPYAMIGHSIGEYTAACISGVITLDDAIKLVMARGKLMQKMQKGTMLSVSISEKQLLNYLTDTISLAAINSPMNCVVSGTEESITNFEKEINKRGIITKSLHTSHAFHSYMMEPMLNEFSRIIENIKLNKPKIPYLSNVTGTWINEDDVITSKYWTDQIRNTVRFNNGIDEINKLEKNALYIEVGAGRSLSTFVKKNDNSFKVFNLVKHPQEEVSDILHLQKRLGELWENGQIINWQEFYKPQNRNKLSIPGYAFAKIKLPSEIKFGGLHSEGKNSTEIVDFNKKIENSKQELTERKDNLKYREPTKESEKIIVEIVEELLSIEPVGIDDDFFDIGGDSLLATQLIARVNKIFRSEVSIKELFNKPSINGLSIELENYWGSKSTVEEIAKTYREFQSIVNKQ